jgi:glycosyltransferase involved in cell wall biosynthesis
MSHKVKVLNFSTHNEDCGIGKYHEMFVDALADHQNIESHFFPVSPNQTRHMGPAELSETLDALGKQLQSFDILHVQHEFSFYKAHEFAAVCSLAKKYGKKLIITYHTSPDVAIKNVGLGGLGPRSFLHFLRQKRYQRRMIQNHIGPALHADTVIVHNGLTENALKSFGVRPETIQRLYLPVPNVKHYKDSSAEIAQGLSKKPGDVILCTIGFMHRYKGIDDAIKALNFLPSNYKLAIIGGIHPETFETQIYNDLCDLIVKNNLIERVYITGFVKGDDRLNKLIRECDMCVYPYDGVYYARVSSAALNLAFSNLMPVVAYPVQTFVEISEKSPAMELTNGFSYYELARSIVKADLKSLKGGSAEYAKATSYSVITKDLAAIYEKTAA